MFQTTNQWLITKYKSPFSHGFPMFQTTNIFFFVVKQLSNQGAVRPRRRCRLHHRLWCRCCSLGDRAGMINKMVTYVVYVLLEITIIIIIISFSYYSYSDY
jgi:hypothetical protein